MKKILFLLLLVTFTFASCCKDEKDNKMTFDDVIGTYQFKHPELGVQIFELRYSDKHKMIDFWGKWYGIDIIEATEFTIVMTDSTNSIIINISKCGYKWIEFYQRGPWLEFYNYVGQITKIS